MKYLSFLIVFLAISQIFAQNEDIISKDELIKYLVENSTSDEIDNTKLYEYFENIYENKINISNVSFEELSLFPFLTIQDISEIIISIKNEQKIVNFDFLYQTSVSPSKLKMLIPFFRIDTKKPTDETGEIEFSARMRNRIVFQNENQVGIDSNFFLGNKLKTYSRIKGNLNSSYFINLLAEKDVGEKNYLDFVSGNISYFGDNLLQKIIIGDFSIDFGEGLLISSSFSSAKSSNVLSVNKNSEILSPYSSSDENSFFRGFATTLNWKNISLSGIFSSNNYDASIDNNQFSSISTSGYHRTNSEIAKHDNLKIITKSAVLEYKSENFYSAGIYFQQQFSSDLLNKTTSNFIGNSIQYASITNKIMFGKLYYSSEIASDFSNFAQIHSIKFQIEKNLSLISTFRNYSKDYYSLFAQGFGENSNTNDEIGFYNGFAYSLFLGKIGFYYDFFTFQTIPEKSTFSSSGNDFLIDFTSKRFNNLHLYIKYKREIKQILTENVIDNLKELENEQTEKFRFWLKFQRKVVQTKTQFDFVQFRELNDIQTGYAISQNFQLIVNDFLKTYLQLAYFQTESYETRIYLYENEIDGMFTNKLLYGNGFQFYFLIKYQPLDFVKFNLKYSQYNKPFEKTLGSGLSEIQSNSDEKITFQIELML